MIKSKWEILFMTARNHITRGMSDICAMRHLHEVGLRERREGGRDMREGRSEGEREKKNGCRARPVSTAFLEDISKFNYLLILH
jgi:hypothetical protein